MTLLLGAEMVNRPKVIGTAAESAVVRYLKVNGFPSAERRALHGQLDEGDITGTPGLCIEVKAGEIAKSLLPGLLLEWMRETEIERINSRADIGLLVIQRRGFGMTRVGHWWGLLPSGVCMPSSVDPHSFIMMEVSAATDLLRGLGYGQALDTE